MNEMDLAAALARPGRASIPYIDPFSADRPLVLECFRPERHDPNKPVVVVQHGMSRNGADYCLGSSRGEARVSRRRDHLPKAIVARCGDRQ
jgi:hypothetical protein